jgi:hypothetical protein
MSVLAVSAITPILKAGDPLEPGNYRGIAVGTLLAKLYAVLVNKRVTDWAEGAGLRAAGQAGFRKDHRTADQIFVLRTLIESARARGAPLFTCFVDFKKAYDLVDRRLLWDKLARRGMPTALLDAVKALYGDVPMLDMLHWFNVCLRDNHCPSQTGHRAHATQTHTGPSLLQPKPRDRNGLALETGNSSGQQRTGVKARARAPPSRRGEDARCSKHTGWQASTQAKHDDKDAKQGKL